jgi:DNA polymerase IV
MNMERYIVHLDMDAFFASIEQRDDSRLKGKPVVVGADPRRGAGRGVVSTCSYEARRFGIHSAMPISRAYRLCPDAVFLPVRMERYAQASGAVFAILSAFTPDIEPISIDEAYLDISSTWHLFGTPHEACVMMKRRIREKTGLTASVGLAPTKMVAKIASDLGKPDGLVEVRREQLRDFLRPLETGAIWGLGPKAQERLSLMGIRTIGELADSDLRELETVFGSNGRYFWHAANGIDAREVESGGAAKSISAETTFDKDTPDRRRVEAEIAGLCERVARRLRKEKALYRTVTLKIRFADFSTHTRSHTRSEPADLTGELIRDAQKLFSDFDTRWKKIRLVGVKASPLIPFVAQLSLFNDDPGGKRGKIDAVTDTIKDRFGEQSISRASVKRR